MIPKTGSVWRQGGRLTLVIRVECGHGTEQFVTYRMLGGEGPFHMLLTDFLEEFKPYEDPQGRFVHAFPEPRTVYERLLDDDAEKPT